MLRSVQVMRASQILEEVSWLQNGLCDGLQFLGKNRHFVASYDGGCRLLFVQRTPREFSSSADLVSSFEDLEEMLRAIPRHMVCLLGDTRKGPARNDPRYEEDMRRVRHKLLGGYMRSATLTGTAAGKLQKLRYAQRDRREILVTTDLGAAFTHLQLPRHVLPPLPFEDLPPDP